MDIELQIRDLLWSVGELLGPDAREMAVEAVEMAREFHQGQVRKSDGAPYLTHPLSLGRSCLAWGLVDKVAVCGAILHDAIEDAPGELGAKKRIFDWNPEVGELVLALSKIRNLQTGAGDMPATYRRILTAASRDVRCLLIKTFDIYDNAETFFVHDDAKARIKASLGLVYVGVARRLGMFDMADALVERLLPYLMPVQTKRATRTLSKLQQESAKELEGLPETLEPLLASEQVKEHILEPKGISDYFHLTEKPGTGQLRRIGWPVYRLRFIVPNEEAAWWVLGQVHKIFGPMPRHIRDYLNAPRINGFKALTTKVLWGGHSLSVHVIREEDEEANRMGILAKWGKSGPKLKPYMRLLGALGDSDLRMSEVHAHVLPDLLDIYTPKGDRLTFPVGAVVLDFAYLVHTELGERCVGALVNGIRRPPEYALVDGDVVDILTGKGVVPQRAWLDVVKTARARTLIKQALKSRLSPVAGVDWDGEGRFKLTALDAPDIRWSSCCVPTPPHKVVGRFSEGGRWIVHRANCDKVSGDVWKAGDWTLKEGDSPTLVATFTLLNRPGSLLQVMALMADHGVNGRSVQSRGKTGENLVMVLEMDGASPEALGSILVILKELEPVGDIREYYWQT